MSPPWDVDELTWARECVSAGDSLPEVAAWSGRSLPDVCSALADLRPMTDRQRRIASLYATGMTHQAIAAELGMTGAFARHSIGADLNDLRRHGYAIPKRTDRWAERRQTIADRQEHSA